MQASRLLVALGLFFAAIGASAASAETRTLKMYFTHTKETVNVTFKKNGRYSKSGLRKINRFLRDWRQNEPTKMDPKLLDIVWEIYKETGSRKPIHVISGYRSPKTNRALRKRGRKVANKSQHMRGRALDWFVPGVSVAKLHAIAMRRHGGGVGHYRGSFIHTDTGSVRHWPRMSKKQLSKIFPRGRTIHTARGGARLRGYKVAAANLKKGLRYDGKRARYGSGGSGGGSVLARIFKRDDEDKPAAKPARKPASKPAVAKREPKPAPAPEPEVQVAAAEPTPAQQKALAAQQALAEAREAKPIIPTLRRTPEPKPEPQPAPQPEVQPAPEVAPTLVARAPVPRPRGIVPGNAGADAGAVVAYAAPQATTNLLRPPADIPGATRQAPVEVAALDPGSATRDPRAEIEALNARIRKALEQQRSATAQASAEARERSRRENEALTRRLARIKEAPKPAVPTVLAALGEPRVTKPAMRWVPGAPSLPATQTSKALPSEVEAPVAVASIPSATAPSLRAPAAQPVPVAKPVRDAKPARPDFLIVAAGAPAAAMRLANLHGRSVKHWAVASTTRTGPVATMRAPFYSRVVSLPMPAAVMTRGFERSRRLRTDSFTGSTATASRIGGLEQLAMR